MNSSLSTVVMMADDHQLFMDGVRSLLNPIEHIVLEGGFTNGDDLLEGLVNHHQTVDVAVIDLSMPGIKTEALLDALLQYNSKIKIIALTMHADVHLARRLLARGLSGYVLKDSAFDEVVLAIETVVNGEVFVSSALKNEITQIELEPFQNQYLTEREEAVLIEVAQGLSNKKIARNLDISERTVRFHLENCCEKLGAQGRIDAVNIARARKLIPW